MCPLSTRNTVQRGGLSVFNQISTIMMSGILVALVFPMAIMPMLGVDKSLWIIVMGVLAGLALPLTLLEYYFTKERVTEEQAAAAAANYRECLPEIIAFMLPSLRQMYGEVTAEEAARKIGRPSIDLDAGQVSYCEQRFDDMHIFSFEFSGDDFQELDYLSIDG